MNKLCPMPGCRVKQITPQDPSLLSITAKGSRPGGRCPECGHASRAVHSRYRRRPADLPSLGRAVRVDLRLRRFYCRNAACPRRTFAERLPELIRPHARRTGRLAQAQARVGAALGDGAPALPSPAQLAWLLVQPPWALAGPDAALVARVEQDPAAAHVAGLARQLTALVRGCGVNPKVGPEAARVTLDTWLADARACGVRALETFAAGLEQDGAAIRAALTTPWSSGQAEGQITRLKLIKRQMYGRASFDLLRRRVLLAA